MIPYSHIVVAARLESLLQPEEPAEYYWGTVAADVRYPARVPRHQTHLPVERFAPLLQQFPQQRSFIQGYLVHCLADEVALKAIFARHVPFSLFKRQLHRSGLAVILEMFHFEQALPRRRISERYNPVLAALGLEENACVKFAQSINRYTSHSTPETCFQELFALMGMSTDGSNSYKKAAGCLQKKPLFTRLLLAAIRRGRISEQISAQVEALLQNTLNELT